MTTIDLRELAKSLMFAEKAKEEVEELRRDNERLYEITVEHAKHFEKDQQTILDLKQTILNLERKVQFLEEGTENLTGALISKGEKAKEMESAIRDHFEDLQIRGLSPSIENLISLHEHACEVIENQTATLKEISSKAANVLENRVEKDTIYSVDALGKVELLIKTLEETHDEMEYYRIKYKEIMSILRSQWPREHNCLLNNMPDGTCGVCGKILNKIRS